MPVPVPLRSYVSGEPNPRRTGLRIEAFRRCLGSIRFGTVGRPAVAVKRNTGNLPGLLEDRCALCFRSPLTLRPQPAADRGAWAAAHSGTVGYPIFTTKSRDWRGIRPDFAHFLGFPLGNA